MIEVRASGPTWAAELPEVERDFGGALGGRGRSLADTRAALDSVLDPAPAHVVVEPADAGGVPALLIGEPRGRGAVVWFHGGGYLLGSAEGYAGAAAAVGAAVGAQVVVPDYRLAPEHPFPGAVEDCVAVAQWAIERYGASQVVLAGDSAGGALCLAVAAALRDVGHPLPAALVLVSPLADLTGGGESMVTNADTDQVIGAAAVRLISQVYLGDHDPRDHRASPLLGDLGGLPPTLLLSASRETLLDDAVRLHDGLIATGGSSQLVLYPDVCHAWTLFPHRLSAARDAIAEIGQFCRKHLPARAPSADLAAAAHRGLRGAVARAWLRDLAWRPPLSAADQVPARPGDIDPDWLNQVLALPPSATVASVRHEPISAGTSVRSRLLLTYDGPTVVDDQHSPSSLFVKSTPTLRTRLQVGATGGAEAEWRFYRDIRPHLDLAAPRGYVGRADRSSGRSILIVEDLAAGRSATFGDPTRHAVDVVRAQALVDTLADLHAALEESPRFAADLRWVRSSLQVQQHLDRTVDFERRTRVGLRRASDIVDDELMGAARDLHGLLLTSLRLDENERTGLVHADVHASNWFHTPGGGMGLFDWSAVARGQGVRDLAYALGSALSTEDRRESERELVDRYTARIAERTGRDRDPEAVWTSYRLQTLHGLCYWLYTLGRGRLQPRMQPLAVTRLNVARLAAATTDLDTIRLIRKHV